MPTSEEIKFADDRAAYHRRCNKELMSHSHGIAAIALSDFDWTEAALGGGPDLFVRLCAAAREGRLEHRTQNFAEQNLTSAVSVCQAVAEAYSILTHAYLDATEKAERKALCYALDRMEQIATTLCEKMANR